MSRINYSSLLPYILLVLYILTGSIKALGAIDILAPQWVYFGTINLITTIYLFFNYSTYNDSLVSLLKNYFFWAYFLLIFWAAGSYFYAINQVETAINFPRYFNVFIACILIFILISKLKSPITFIMYLFAGFLLIELVAYYNDFLDVYSKDKYFSLTRVKGVSGNKNITAASIALKIPFLLYLVNISKSKIIKGISFALLTISFLAISLINARAAILSSSFCLFLYILYYIYRIISNKKSLKDSFISIAYGFFAFLISFLLNESLASSANTNSFTRTVAKIEFTKDSSNGRFDYWQDVLSQLKDNPILGCGLGNWKIASIFYGKRHINGYTVPYHAHNDFFQFFAELGLFGGVLYSSLFIYIFLSLIIFFYRKRADEDSFIFIILGLALFVYSLDASLNFPIARPLMQSSFVILIALILFLIVKPKKEDSILKNKILYKIFFSISFLVILFCTVIHYISYNSLTKQGKLLYEFNNNSFKMSVSEVDQISDTFPNLTETALPIKSMKARYYYLNNLKEKAYQYASLGAKDNPYIYFSENLKGQFFFQEGKIDSAYVLSKVAFDNIPRNKPHFDLYMRTLISKKDFNGIDKAFERAKEVFGNDPIIWQIYLQALAQTRSIGDPIAMEMASKAHNLFTGNDSIFTLYKILTYGQYRMAQAEKIGKEAIELYNKKEFQVAFEKFKEANDLDPLDPVYPLNAGLSLYESKQYEKAIHFFNIAIPRKFKDHSLRAMRYKALSLYILNRRQEACLIFDKLRLKGNKRMHMQEFQKYCK
ncbi:MAG: O-antigen ligase family protein [Flavobacteriaceae bacterium]|nr:O-antigen ligase family protein [Flavobacteriaceae bacterium]